MSASASQASPLQLVDCEGIGNGVAVPSGVLVSWLKSML
jgi:hypothetical protein